MQPDTKRLLDQFVGQVGRLAPHPTPADISKAVSMFAERLPVSDGELAKFLEEKDLPPPPLAP